MVGGGMGGWVGGWPVCEAWVDGVMGLRVGFININDMYNNDVGKGGVRGVVKLTSKIKGGAG